MTSVQKLGNICLQIVIDLGIEVSNENLPVQLVKKINEMKAINGQYITQDHMDKISYIGINYDGDTIDLNFKIFGVRFFAKQIKESSEREIKAKFSSVNSTQL